MKNLLMVIQIFIAVAMVTVILLQTRGTGFSRSSSGASFSRRGLESLVFKLTFILAGLFILISALQLWL